MSEIVLAELPDRPIFGFGEEIDGVFGFGIGYWATVLDDSKYLDLITSEHDTKPKYMNMVSAITQPFVDEQVTVEDFVPSYDLDLAIGHQLDVCGQWIGLSRRVQVPITNIYFSLDILGLGLDQADWFHVGDALFNTVILEDDAYRRLLQAKASANQWDGTVPGAYEVYDVFFNGTRTSILIHDHQDMTMSLEIVGVIPDDATLALLAQDYLGLRPEGVTLLPLIV